MTFIEGINVKGTATLNEIMLLKDLVSENFNLGGSGFGIYRDADGNYHLDIDFVDIRKTERGGHPGAAVHPCRGAGSTYRRRHHLQPRGGQGHILALLFQDH